MDKYEYKGVIIAISSWTGKFKMNYVDVLNEYGAQGWKFIQFNPGVTKHKGVRGYEIIFERKITGNF